MKKFLLPHCVTPTLWMILAMTFAAADPAPKIEAEGVVEPFRRVRIPARATGVVREVFVEEGANVKEGDALAKLDDTSDQYEVEYSAALARLYKTRAEMYRRLEGIESADKIKEAVESGEASEARLRRAKKIMEDKTIRAPAPGGIILRRLKHVGEAIEERETMFEMINIERAYFVAFLDAKHFGQVRVGQPATITVGSGNPQNFTGRVEQVDPAVDAGSGQFRVRVLLENPDRRITAGLKGKVQLGE